VCDPFGRGFGVDRVFAARDAGAQHVERDASDDGGEPAGEVVDGGGVGAGEAQPGLLHGVVGFGERAEHAVGDGAEMRAVLFEASGEEIGVGHPVTFSRSGASW